MAIKVIKHGKKTFKATCPNCGCEFEYELEDIKQEPGLSWNYQGNLVFTSTCYCIYNPKYVICPDCGRHIYHWDYSGLWVDTNDKINIENQNISLDDFTYTLPNDYTDNLGHLNIDPCDTCAWGDYLKKNPKKTFEAGDTPCTWCPKHSPKCE